MRRRVPFNKPCLAGNELHYISQAVEQGNIGGDGQFSRRCAERLQELFEISKVLLTTSCTSALEMAAMLCDLETGDEVIMPSYTFVSTANAVVRTGARPVFVDIRPDTLNLDESLVEAAVTARTRAIFAVHYAGVGCEMDRLMEIAGAHDLTVVEDAAQGVNAEFRERALGAIGHLGAYSFHETKNYSCGEGGALCINDERFVERAEWIRDKGTNRRAFMKGQTDKYTWVDIGSSYAPSDLNCAFLYGQLEALAVIASRREEIYQRYSEGLGSLAEAGKIALPVIPDHCRSNHHLFHILLQSRDERDALLRHLNDRGLQAVFHYVPLHDSPMGRRLGNQSGQLPITESIAGRLLRLPLYFDLSTEDQALVTSEIHSFFGNMHEL